MSIITISRGSYSHGKEVAEKVAKILNYDCISRDILLAASENYNIPEIKLENAISEGPSILDKFIRGKEKYVAYIQSALLGYLKEDNFVYHGLAGHFFLKNVTHALKVRIIADIEERIKIIIQREKVSEKDAIRILKNYDEQRRKWSLHLYGIDTHDPTLYDLVIHIKQITVDDAVDIILNTVKRESFQTTDVSRKLINDLALAAMVKASVIAVTPEVEVFSDYGMVLIKAKIHEFDNMEIIDKLKNAAMGVKGVKEVNVDIHPGTFFTD